MSASDQLAAQLKRLGHPSSVFRRQAAVGVFQLLAAGAARGSHDAAKDAILACLTDRHAVRGAGARGIRGMRGGLRRAWTWRVWTRPRLSCATACVQGGTCVHGPDRPEFPL